MPPMSSKERRWRGAAKNAAPVPPCRRALFAPAQFFSSGCTLASPPAARWSAACFARMIVCEMSSAMLYERRRLPSE